MKAKPYFSVILPVYNSAQTLNRALVSILAQTFSDYELLVIENASTDNSLEIARAYEKSFDTMRVFHLDERGVSRARNTGLDNASGEYVVFLDADDFYMPNALRIMHSVLQSENPDILITAFTNYASNESERMIRASGRDLYLAMLDPVKYYPRIVDGIGTNEFLLRHQCAKAYRRSMITDKNVRFNEDCPMYVDLIFNMSAYSACSSALLIFKKLYQYNRVPGSIVNRTGPAIIEDAAAAFAALVSQLEPLDGERRDAALAYSFTMILYMLKNHVSAPSEKGHSVLEAFLKDAKVQNALAFIAQRKLHPCPAVNGRLHGLLEKLLIMDLTGALAFFSKTESNDYVVQKHE